MRFCYALKHKLKTSFKNKLKNKARTPKEHKHKSRTSQDQAKKEQGVPAALVALLTRNTSSGCQFLQGNIT
jgi:hypothetical protein